MHNFDAVGDRDELVRCWSQKVEGQGYSDTRCTFPTDAYRSMVCYWRPLSSFMLSSLETSLDWFTPALTGSPLAYMAWNALQKWLPSSSAFSFLLYHADSVDCGMGPTWTLEHKQSQIHPVAKKCRVISESSAKLSRTSYATLDR